MSECDLPSRQEIYERLKARSLEIQSENKWAGIILTPPQPPRSGWDFAHGNYQFPTGVHVSFG